MRALIIFPLLFAIAPASPSSDHERVVVTRMAARYDYPALTAFLKQCIRAHPEFEKVSLASSKVESRWYFEKVDPPSRMRSGDWVIWDQKDEDEAFDLYYSFDSSHVVLLHAKRVARDKFELLGISIDEWISLR